MTVAEVERYLTSVGLIPRDVSPIGRRGKTIVCVDVEDRSGKFIREGYCVWSPTRPDLMTVYLYDNRTRSGWRRLGSFSLPVNP